MRPLPRLLRVGFVPLFLLATGCPHPQPHQAGQPARRLQVQDAGSAEAALQMIEAKPAAPDKDPSVELLVPELLPGEPLRSPDSSPATKPLGENAREIAIRELKTLGARISQPEDGKLFSIDLTNSKAGDEVVGWLLRIPDVQQLDLSGTQISDWGLAKLSPMPRLEFLNLAHTAVGDGGLRWLPSMPELKYVVLNGTKVTDASLPVLAQISSLDGVSLLETAVTAQAIEAFQKQRPDCTVIGRDTNASNADERPAPKKPFAAPMPPAPLPSSVMLNQRTPLVRATEAPRLQSTSSLENDLQDAAFLKTVSEIYMKREEWAKAVSVLRRAIELDPSNPSLRHDLGIALGRTGELEESFSELQRADGDANAHYSMGMIVYENALNQSRAHFQTAVSLDPKNAGAQSWLRFLNTQTENPLDSPAAPQILPAGGTLPKTSNCKNSK